ncbi:molybdenum cofactor guanylyltransferase MobA [Thiohalomonas denitrificans]|uniref:Molybdenum cofactor guanylyltransferase n=1 Tax=Thiohalomonas denitrificans TaxID=415747 RepID=A0A1G5PL18_9GAMM|nr:molybdenum cofactor guanylyltransferase MobA [Thiohalomonas denitrificans]SCZ49871.1 molybdopterin-guanine dinucleotide biosynthesis protein A [Thiohalomonas denitrificans]
MPPTAENITAIILAGGRGQRMGGQDKGLLPLAGRPLIAHVIERIRPQVGEIVISANRNHEHYSRFGYPVFADAAPDWPGPLAGLLAGFAVTDSEWVLTLPCDTPRLPQDLAARMISATMEADAEICTVQASGRIQAAFMLVSRRLEADLRDYIDAGGRRVQSWQEAHHRALAEYPEADRAFDNINTPEQLQQLERELKDNR